jgi:leader peptidase (prepilin peptidase)/N-methyltransferase
LFSYIILLGKCRYCGKKISFRYFTVELLTAILFAYTVYRFPVNENIYDTVIYLVFSCIMIAVTFIDIDHYIIPDRFSIGLIILGFAVSPLDRYPLNLSHIYSGLSYEWQMRVLNSAIGAAAAGGIFYMIYYLSNLYYSKKNMEAFGFGDVKLAAGIGAVLGWKFALCVLFFSFVFGVIMAIPLMLFGNKGMKDQMPFGPAICISALFTVFAGEHIIDFYSNSLSYYIMI